MSTRQIDCICVGIQSHYDTQNVRYYYNRQMMVGRGAGLHYSLPISKYYLGRHSFYALTPKSQESIKRQGRIQQQYKKICGFTTLIKLIFASRVNVKLLEVDRVAKIIFHACPLFFVDDVPLTSLIDTSSLMPLDISHQPCTHWHLILIFKLRPYLILGAKKACLCFLYITFT